MKVVYTDEAIDSLEELLEFISGQFSERTVEQIRTTLLDRCEELAGHPKMGKKEPYLAHTGKPYRSIIEHHCKIIYLIQDTTIHVTDFFDTRQDPDKLRG